RHTRFSRDWSSDVCSSDLLLHHLVPRDVLGQIPVQRAARAARALRTDHVGEPVQHVGELRHVAAHALEWILGPVVVPVAGTVEAEGSVTHRVAPGMHDGLISATLAGHGKVAYTRKGAPAW